MCTQEHYTRALDCVRTFVETAEDNRKKENHTFRAHRVDNDDVPRQRLPRDWRFSFLSAIGLGFGVEAEPHMGMATILGLLTVDGQVHVEVSEDASDLATAGHGHVLQVPQNGDLPKE